MKSISIIGSERCLIMIISERKGSCLLDIALITKCDRMEAKRYSEGLAEIATKLAMKYFVVVNFACLPFDDFTAKKTWYGFYRNIDSDGKVLNPEI